MIKVKKFTFNPFQENTYIISNEKKECIIIDPGCSNLNEEKEINFYIVTSNKDLNSKKELHGIKSNAWQQINKSKVIYLDERSQNQKMLRKIINDIKPDKIYLNGTADGSPADVTMNTPTGTAPLNIGKSETGEYFEGNIAVGRVYNRRLTDSEVLQNYNALKGRFGL